MLHFKDLYDLWGCQLWELQCFRAIAAISLCVTPARAQCFPLSLGSANLESRGIYMLECC